MGILRLQEPHIHSIESITFQTQNNMSSDKSIVKLSSKTAPKGEMGQKYLAAGVHMGMRLWENEKPAEPSPATKRDYEVLGYVISGKAELLIEGQTVLLEEGDSWLVPKGSSHTYKILENFTAVEATSPCAFVKGRDHAN